MSDLPAALILSLRQLGDPALARVWAKSMGLTLLLFLAFGAALMFGLGRALDGFGLAGDGTAAALVGAILAILLAWVGFRIVAIAMLQFFADEIVAAVEAKHYAASAHSLRKVGWREEARRSVRSVLRAIGVNALALPVALISAPTGFGPPLVLALANSWLVGRELQDMVWLRHCRETNEAMPLSAPLRLLLGAVVTVLLMVPVAGLLAPVIGAASATHLVHRRISHG